MGKQDQGSAAAEGASEEVRALGKLIQETEGAPFDGDCHLLQG